MSPTVASPNMVRMTPNRDLDRFYTNDNLVESNDPDSGEDATSLTPPPSSIGTQTTRSSKKSDQEEEDENESVIGSNEDEDQDNDDDDADEEEDEDLDSNDNNQNKSSNLYTSQSSDNNDLTEEDDDQYHTDEASNKEDDNEKVNGENNDDSHATPTPTPQKSTDAEVASTPTSIKLTNNLSNPKPIGSLSANVKTTVSQNDTRGSSFKNQDQQAASEKQEPYYHTLFQWEQLVSKGVTRPLLINDLDFTDLRDEDDCDLLNTNNNNTNNGYNNNSQNQASSGAAGGPQIRHRTTATGEPLHIKIPVQRSNKTGDDYQDHFDSGTSSGPNSGSPNHRGNATPITAPPPLPPPPMSPWYNTYSGSRPQSQLLLSPTPSFDIGAAGNDTSFNRDDYPTESRYSNHSRNSLFLPQTSTPTQDLSATGRLNNSTISHAMTGMHPVSSLRSASSMSSLLFGDNGKYGNKRKKTMKLFWKEVREDRSLLSKLTKKKTIWDEIKPVPVDTQKLEYLFESKAKDLSLSRSRNGLDGLSQRKAKITVLDTKRSNAINIGMTKLPPMRTIKSAILKMDSNIMNREGIEKILTTMMPTEEEKSRIIEAQLANPETPLGTAEQFLLNLASISALEARLKLWAFQLDYAQIEKEVAEPLMDLKQAIKEIEQSETFRLILGTLLSIGNFLNCTNVKGFQIDYLEKVPEVKDTVHKHSLLHHLCVFMQERYPHTGDLYSEFSAVNRASKIDYVEVGKNLKKMQQDCKASWDYLKIVAKHDGLANLMNTSNNGSLSGTGTGTTTTTSSISSSATAAASSSSISSNTPNGSVAPAIMTTGSVESTSSRSGNNNNNDNNNSQQAQGKPSCGKLNNLSRLSMITTITSSENHHHHSANRDDQQTLSNGTSNSNSISSSNNNNRQQLSYDQAGLQSVNGSSTSITSTSNGSNGKQMKTKVSDFLTDCAERIMVLMVIHRRIMNRFQKLLVYLGCPSHQIKQTLPHQVLKVINEFALEYRTKLERVKEMISKRQQCKHPNHPLLHNHRHHHYLNNNGNSIVGSTRWSQLDRTRWAGSQQYLDNNNRPCSTASSYANNPACVDLGCCDTLLRNLSTTMNNNNNTNNNITHGNLPANHHHQSPAASNQKNSINNSSGHQSWRNSPSGLSNYGGDYLYHGNHHQSSTSRQQSVTPVPCSDNSQGHQTNGTGRDNCSAHHHHLMSANSMYDLQNGGGGNANKSADYSYHVNRQTGDLVNGNGGTPNNNSNNSSCNHNSSNRNSDMMDNGCYRGQHNSTSSRFSSPGQRATPNTIGDAFRRLSVSSNTNTNNNNSNSNNNIDNNDNNIEEQEEQKRVQQRHKDEQQLCQLLGVGKSFDGACSDLLKMSHWTSTSQRVVRHPPAYLQNRKQRAASIDCSTTGSCSSPSNNNNNLNKSCNQDGDREDLACGQNNRRMSQQLNGSQLRRQSWYHNGKLYNATNESSRSHDDDDYGQNSDEDILQCLVRQATESIPSSTPGGYRRSSNGYGAGSGGSGQASRGRLLIAKDSID